MKKFLENLKCWLLVAVMMCGLNAAAQTEDEVYGAKLMTYLKTYDGHKTELKSFGKILSKRGLEGEAAKVWIDKYVGEQFEKDMKELYVPFYKDIVTAEELDTLTQLYSSEEFKMLEQKLEENIQSVAEKFKDSDVLKTYSKEAISCLLENKPYKPLPPVECSESYRVKCDTLVSDVSQMLAAGTLMATMFSWELVSGEQKEKITDEQWAGFTVYLVDVWKNVMQQFFVEVFTEHDLDIMIEVQRAPVSVRFSAKMLESLSGVMKISRQLDERFEAWFDEEICKEAQEKLEEQKDNPEALYDLGNYYSKKGAEEDYEYSKRYKSDKGEYQSFSGTSAYHVKAFQLWEKAANQNHLEAIKKLVNAYRNGVGVQVDQVKATQWTQRGAELSNDGELLFMMAWNHAKGIGTPIDSVEAVKWYERAAEAGHLTATCNLGWCYQNAFGCKEDAAKAFYWYSVAAEKGSDLAQNNLGYCYLVGYGTEPDKKKAIEWLKKAVEQGVENAFPLLFANHDDPKDCADFFKKVAADASLFERHKKANALTHWIYTIKQYPELLNDSTEELRTLLPMMKINGKYFSKEQSHTPQYFVHYEFLCELLFNPCVSSKDYQAALAWVRSAVKDCSDDLKLFYSELMLHRPELASDPEEGVRIIQELAETGNPEYQYQLGKVYFEGIGVPANKPEAIKWFTLAANNGSSSACAHLYDCYDKGIGCQADPKETFKWLEKTVELSGVKVEDLIGEAYLYGKGVEKDVQKGIGLLEAEYSTKLLPYYWKNKRYNELLKYCDKALNSFIHASKRPAFYFYKALASWELNDRKQVAEFLGLGWEHIKYNGIPEEWNADEVLVMVDGDYHKILHRDSVQVDALTNKQIFALLGFEKKDVEEVMRKVGYQNKTFLIFIKTKNWTEKMNLNSKSSNTAIAELFFDYAQYFEDKDKDAAYKAYDLSLQYNPEDVLCLNNYAYLLACNREDLEKAESMSRKAIEAKPDNAAYLDTHAWALFQQGKYDFAKIYIDKVIEMEITSEELDHAGDIYFHCGLKDKAIELWKVDEYPRLNIHDGLSQEAVAAKRKLQDELSSKFVRPSYHPALIIYKANAMARDWKKAPLK